MSTSLLYHAFGVNGHKYVSTEYHGGSIWFTVVPRKERLRCSRCRSRIVTKKGKETRVFKTVPIGGRQAFIRVRIPRVYCHCCHIQRQIKIGFADIRVRYTRAFERYALELLKHMPISAVAKHLKVCWDTIKDIEKRYLKRICKRPKLRKLKRIAIDEVATGKGHKYITVVLDLQSGAVLHVGKGKGGDALQEFFKRLRRSGARIEAVAIDMSPAYIAAVETHMPLTEIVFDRFHVIKLMNDKLTKLRRLLYEQANTRMQGILKGTRWLLLKNPENLKESTNEGQRLQEALRLNAPLATAYYLKEDLRQFWTQPNRREAEAFLRGWIARAYASQVTILRRFASLIKKHSHGLLAWYEHPISTGPLEGTNNKIQLMKRKGYGYRNMEFFKLKIYALHMQKHA